MNLILILIWETLHVNNQTNSNSKCDGGDDENGQNKILHFFRHPTIVVLLFPYSKTGPDDDWIWREKVPDVLIYQEVLYEEPGTVEDHEERER